MQTKQLEKQARLLKAIAHPLRILIIRMLAEKSEMHVSEMLTKLKLDQQPAEQSLISHHLINMKDKGILDAVRRGKNMYYKLDEATRVHFTAEGSLSIAID